MSMDRPPIENLVAAAKHAEDTGKEMTIAPDGVRLIVDYALALETRLAEVETSVREFRMLWGLPPDSVPSQVVTHGRYVSQERARLLFENLEITQELILVRTRVATLTEAARPFREKVTQDRGPFTLVSMADLDRLRAALAQGEGG